MTTHGDVIGVMFLAVGISDVHVGLDLIGTSWCQISGVFNIVIIVMLNGFSATYVAGHPYVVPRPHVLCAILSKLNVRFLRIEVGKQIPVLLFLCWVVECCGVREAHVGPEDTRKPPNLVLVSWWACICFLLYFGSLDELFRISVHKYQRVCAQKLRSLY